jgi:two-component system response regulator RegX3
VVVGSNVILFAGREEPDWAAVSVPLELAGFTPVWEHNGNQALASSRESTFDLAILDINLDGIGAFETCRFIHDVFHIPVMLVTSPENDQQILDGLDAGATDFLMRPIRSYELVARVRTILKRTSSPLALPGWILQCEDLLLDLRSHCVIRSGASTPLTRTDMRLLSYLMRNSGRIVSKADLLENVWHYKPISGDYNLVDSAIKRLRQSIEDDPKNPKYIFTVWGEGYRFGR